MPQTPADQLQLATELDRLRREVRSLAERARASLDEYQQGALGDLQRHLGEMADECRSGAMRPRNERYGYVARLVVEMDPTVMAPEFGGLLIDAEQRYRDV